MRENGGNECNMNFIERDNTQIVCLTASEITDENGA